MTDKINQNAWIVKQFPGDTPHPYPNQDMINNRLYTSNSRRFSKIPDTPKSKTMSTDKMQEEF